MADKEKYIQLYTNEYSCDDRVAMPVEFKRVNHLCENNKNKQRIFFFDFAEV